MAWINTIAADDQNGQLDTILNRVRDPESGEVDAIMSVHSLHPEGLTAHEQLYNTVMRPSPTLPKVERELIAFVVSQINNCHY